MKKRIQLPIATVVRGVAAALATHLLAACANFPTEADFTRCQSYARSIPAPRLTKAATQNRDTIEMPGLLRALDDCAASNHAFKAVVISGGGADGAYGTGFLAYKIRNPGADIPLAGACLVTGVSTGAVMAPFIFLATGTPSSGTDYLTQLETLYAKLNDDALIRRHPFIALSFFPSIYDVAGIRRLITKKASDTLLSDIALEGAKGRRLLVGATDLYTGQFLAFDLTRIAADRTIDDATKRACFAEAVRASAAIPVAFPPVPITNAAADPPARLLLVDGGVRHMVFLFESLFKRMDARENPIVVFGVLNTTFALSNPDTKLPILNFGARDVAIATDQLYLDSAYQVDQAAKRENATTFWTSAKGATCRKADGSIFDPQYQKCLLDYGEKTAKDTGWQQFGAPPDFK